MAKKFDFMHEKLMKDGGEAFSPARYSLKSGNDAILSPYKTYELFFEETFYVHQKLGAYESIGTPDECREAMEAQKHEDSLADITPDIVAAIKKAGMKRFGGVYTTNHGYWYAQGLADAIKAVEELAGEKR